jgi:hypothetical protein
VGPISAKSPFPDVEEAAIYQGELAERHLRPSLPGNSTNGSWWMFQIQPTEAAPGFTNPINGQLVDCSDPTFRPRTRFGVQLGRFAGEAGSEQSTNFR